MEKVFKNRIVLFADVTEGEMLNVISNQSWKRVLEAYCKPIVHKEVKDILCFAVVYFYICYF